MTQQQLNKVSCLCSSLIRCKIFPAGRDRLHHFHSARCHARIFRKTHNWKRSRQWIEIRRQHSTCFSLVIASLSTSKSTNWTEPSSKNIGELSAAVVEERIIKSFTRSRMPFKGNLMISSRYIVALPKSTKNNQQQRKSFIYELEIEIKFH